MVQSELKEACTQCSICQESFVGTDMIYGHSKHLCCISCLLEWFFRSSSRSCPVCRIPLHANENMASLSVKPFSKMFPPLCEEQDFSIPVVQSICMDQGKVVTEEGTAQKRNHCVCCGIEFGNLAVILGHYEHRAHADCLLTWFDITNSRDCPTCSRGLTIQEDMFALYVLFSIHPYISDNAERAFVASGNEDRDIDGSGHHTDRITAPSLRPFGQWLSHTHTICKIAMEEEVKYHMLANPNEERREQHERFVNFSNLMGSLIAKHGNLWS